MARTQAKDYGERRRKILNKAAILFAEKGYARASISEIAKACEASKSWLYHYYPSKEAILFDIMMLYLTELLEAAENANDVKDKPEDKLRQLARNLMKIYVGASSKHNIIIHDIDCLSKEDRLKIHETQNKIIKIAESILCAINPSLQDNKSLKKPTVMALLGMLNWAHTWFKKGGELKSDEFADMAVDIFLNGMSGKKYTP